MYCWQHQKCKKLYGVTVEKTASHVSADAPADAPEDQMKTPIKVFVEPFIQKSATMVAFDPNLGKNVIKTEQSTLLENVVGDYGKPRSLVLVINHLSSHI
jgi:hypothetical protein